MESVEYHAAAAMLAWQFELGADEAICDAPVDRYALPAAMEKPAAPVGAKGDAKAATKPKAPIALAAEIDTGAEAQRVAAAAGDLEALRAAIAAFVHCDLQRGARNLVFGQGAVGAHVMVVGELPSRDEDREGAPFVGVPGTLLDKMFGAIDLARTGDAPTLYVTTALPWRTPQGRDPSRDDLAMMTPFLQRQIELVNPKVLILMGNTPCQMILGKRGITRMRGDWAEGAGRPCLPMVHPASLLRNPVGKRDAWADLLGLKARLREVQNAGA